MESRNGSLQIIYFYKKATYPILFTIRSLFSLLFFNHVLALSRSDILISFFKRNSPTLTKSNALARTSLNADFHLKLNKAKVRYKVFYSKRIIICKIYNMNCYCIWSKTRFNIFISNYRIIPKS